MLNADLLDVAAHHALARTTAEQSAVLLKNEDILPFQKDKKIAFIGEFAKVPRIQGGGSSHINNTSIESALDAAGDSVSYAQGFHIDEETTDRGDSCFRKRSPLQKKAMLPLSSPVCQTLSRAKDLTEPI